MGMIMFVFITENMSLNPTLSPKPYLFTLMGPKAAYTSLVAFRIMNAGFSIQFGTILDNTLPSV